MDLQNLNYRIRSDIDFLMDADSKSLDEFSGLVGVSRGTLYDIKNGKLPSASVTEKIYNYAYTSGYRLNIVKEELLKETAKNTILFHGSRRGLTSVSEHGPRENCDFGHGFYLSERYAHALAFVCEGKDSSVYSFSCDLDGLRLKTFDCNLDWMLAICYYRGTISPYADTPLIQKIIADVEQADVVIAPIADNRMFYIMTQFASGDINADAAMHSLSASRLGLQYIFRTEKAIETLRPMERYYLCQSEKNDCIEQQKSRGAEIETKLKLAKREFRSGKYIEELLQ